MSGGATRVVYLLGRGRSGSTIVAESLGALDGFFSAGELRVLWHPVLTSDSPCGCGAPVSSCPVWSQVLARLAHVDREQVARWQREVVRESRLPRLLRRDADQRWPALAGYRQVMGEVYAAIREVTGCRTILDSSKRPSAALVVRDLSGIEPYFLHLVRDPRASAYSWRTRSYTGAAGTQVAQPGALDATLRWDVLNLGAEVVLRTVAPHRRLQLRYEDFAAAPMAAVDRVSALAGGPAAETVFLDERTVQAPDGHALSGNPARSRTGPIEVRPDRGWRTDQRTADRWLATVVAAPLLPRYGYPLRPSSSE